MTGAAGGVGRMLRPGLAGLAEEVRLVDLRPSELGAGEVEISGDVTDLDVIRPAIRGCDACIHLAAIPVEAPFEDILHANLRGAWTVFEAARREGCERVVLASSNHATGFHAVGRRIGPEAPVRPDTCYGASKALGEALGSLHHDRFGLRVACIRIGTALERPREERHLSTWHSSGDLARLARAGLTSPDLGFAIVYGVSNNRRRWWDLESGRRLGYEPVDDAEAYASEVEAAPVGDRQGGPRFTGERTTP